MMDSAWKKVSDLTTQVFEGKGHIEGRPQLPGQWHSNTMSQTRTLSRHRAQARDRRLDGM